MYKEMFKVFGDFKTPAFDFSSLVEVQRRNMEAFTAANQVVAQGAQEIARRQSEVIRDGVEGAVKASKDMATSGGTPEFTVEKQAALSKEMVEKSLSNAREMSEMVSKLGFEAFDMINKRATESFEELGKVATAK